MSIEALSKVIEEDALPVEVAEMYLNIYVGQTDWVKQINKLWINLENKNKNIEASKEQIKKVIACTALLPTIEKTTIPDPVYLILFWCTGWSQLNEKDWFSLFQDVVKKDLLIQSNRKKLLEIGIIDPIDYSPLTRQAFNWLYSEAEASGCINDSNKKDIEKKMQNLVRIYGGAVISNIFTNHKASIGKIHSWRNGYFFEREIYNVYSFDQINKIKNLEIQKLNPKYIKTLEK
jgi:predicted nucleic acid binding AN1-type Zn finger protein